MLSLKIKAANKIAWKNVKKYNYLFAKFGCEKICFRKYTNIILNKMLFLRNKSIISEISFYKKIKFIFVKQMLCTTNKVFFLV